MINYSDREQISGCDGSRLEGGGHDHKGVSSTAKIFVVIEIVLCLEAAEWWFHESIHVTKWHGTIHTH